MLENCGQALCALHRANFNTQLRFDVGLGLLPPEGNGATLNDLTRVLLLINLALAI